jgi:hypothetical protein
LAKPIYPSEVGIPNFQIAPPKPLYVIFIFPTRSTSGFVAGTAGPTIADICVFEIVDLHLRLFPDEVKAIYPELVSHHSKIAAIPSISAYLSGPQRLAKVNANNLG